MGRSSKRRFTLSAIILTRSRPREEIGRYIEHYHHRRPHQALMNFTPAHVHEQNNKSRLLAELKEMKRKTREKRKEFWSRRSETTVEFDSGGSLGMGRPRSV